MRRAQLIGCNTTAPLPVTEERGMRGEAIGKRERIREEGRGEGRRENDEEHCKKRRGGEMRRAQLRTYQLFYQSNRREEEEKREKGMMV